jgi:apolipoprotein N-acyltransferase
VPRTFALSGRRRQDPVGTNDYYNTAFVVGTNGDIVFKQAKSVPIQFFKDGLPAPEQEVWNSPWGKIGICICYDLSYTRVTDELVRQGAQLLIVPDDGRGRLGPAPARTSRASRPCARRNTASRFSAWPVPAFRKPWPAEDMSSRKLPFPGNGEIFSAQLRLPMRGSLPLDRYLAELAFVVLRPFDLHGVDGFDVAVASPSNFVAVVR